MAFNKVFSRAFNKVFSRAFNKVFSRAFNKVFKACKVQLVQIFTDLSRLVFSTVRLPTVRLPTVRLPKLQSTLTISKLSSMRAIYNLIANPVNLVLVLLTLWGSITFERYHSYLSVVASAKDKLSIIAKTVSQSVDSLIQTQDQLLLFQRQQGILDIAFLTHLKQFSAWNQEIGSINWFDENFFLVSFTAPEAAPLLYKLNIKETSFAKYFINNPIDMLFVSKPFVCRITHATVISLTRPLIVNNKLKGLLVSTLDLDTLRSIYKNMHLENSISISLNSANDTLFSTGSDNGSDTSTVLPHVAPVLNAQELIIWQQSNKYNFIVSISQSYSSILSTFTVVTYFMIGLALVFSLVVCYATYVAQQSIRHFVLLVQQCDISRDIAEQEATRANTARKLVEQAYLLSEESRLIAEYARQESETSRLTAELARQESESARQESESAREDSERAREDSERAREEAETQKQLAEEARSKAEAADRLKSAFLASVSHELRTPLNAIIGFSDCMLSLPLAASKLNEYASYIHSSGELLLSLVNDILDLAKIESGNVDLEYAYFPLEEIIQSCVTLTESSYGKLPVLLCFDSRLMVYSDSMRIRQIILNLLTNAIKFSSHPRKIRISATVLTHVASDHLDNKQVIKLIIADNGIGMSKSDIKVALQPFRQVSQGNARQYQGTGLGLAIVDKLVKLLHGTMDIVSEKGVGTTVTILLPHTPLNQSSHDSF